MSISLILSIYGAILSTYIFWYNIKFRKPTWMLLIKSAEEMNMGEHELVIQIFNVMPKPLIIWEFEIEIKDGNNYKICRLVPVTDEQELYTLSQGTIVGLPPITTLQTNTCERLPFVYSIDDETKIRKAYKYEKRDMYLILHTANGKKYRV